ncbi:MAG: siroheme synthase CysG [Symbiopectobacterium sp.]|uniref:siroheme synthase CysG n=1 Tax=Symbiopectobacterium sp. TaxID=2952789 RepID=UPI0039E7D9AA
MDYLPLFYQLRDKHCLLVGGGDVAEHKARLLLDAGARLTVNALTFSPSFLEWGRDSKVTLLMRPFTPLVAGRCLAGDRRDRQCGSEPVDLRQRHTGGVSFAMWSIPPCWPASLCRHAVDRSPLMMIAVSSGGKAPVLARMMREKLESLLPLHLGKLATLAGTLRDRVKRHYANGSERRRFWEKLFSHDRLVQSLANNDVMQTETLTDALFNTPLNDRSEVTLVGAGPGDAGLMTLKGLQQLQQADVVVYDRLVSEEMLNLVRRDAECIYVGKQSGYHSLPQEQINQLLQNKAAEGKRVVRLKGGDPMIFGRGGEELEHLQQAGIPFSVVPGITAASGCAAYSGIPLTHRDYAQEVRLVTGHVTHNGDLDWVSLAQEKQTLVFYMGLIQGEHIQHGADSGRAHSA